MQEKKANVAAEARKAVSMLRGENILEESYCDDEIIQRSITFETVRNLLDVGSPQILRNSLDLIVLGFIRDQEDMTKKCRESVIHFYENVGRFLDDIAFVDFATIAKFSNEAQEEIQSLKSIA